MPRKLAQESAEYEQSNCICSIVIKTRQNIWLEHRINRAPEPGNFGEKLLHNIFSDERMDTSTKEFGLVAEVNIFTDERSDN